MRHWIETNVKLQLLSVQFNINSLVSWSISLKLKRPRALFGRINMLYRVIVAWNSY